MLKYCLWQELLKKTGFKLPDKGAKIKQQIANYSARKAALDESIASKSPGRKVLKEPHVIETRSFLTIGFVLITAKAQAKTWKTYFVE